MARPSETSSSAAANGRPASSSKNRSRFWRSLSDWQQSEDFDQYLHREFPVAASEFPEGVSRRRWMQIMGASLAMAGVAGCRYPEELIAPFVLRPEGRVPGERYLRATNIELAGRVYHLLISCVDGRPLKVEPNTDHPAGGGTDVYSQASILSLFDPDRARVDDGPLAKASENGRRVAAGWDEFTRYGQALIRTAESSKGRSFALLMQPTRSPSTVRMIKQLQSKLPEMTIARYDSVTNEVMRKATTQAFGKPAQQVLNLADAKTIVTLEADVLGRDAGFVNNAAGFAQSRDPNSESMSRLYVVEGGYTQTGATADARLSLRPSQMAAFLAELERRVDAASGESADEETKADTAYDQLDHAGRLKRFIESLASDIAASPADSVVVVGEHLGPEAIAAGIRLNQKLGSLGKLQTFTSPADAEIEDSVSVAELADKIGAGEIDSLVIVDGNPVFTAPADVDLAAAIAAVDNSVYLGEYDDETGAVCKWSVPVSHPLESWNDTVDDHGYYGVTQPQILPLLSGKTVPEALAVMMGLPVTSGEQIVRATAEQVSGASISNRQWRKLLHDGYAEDLKQDDEEFTPSGDAPTADADALVVVEQADKDDIEVIFHAADGIFDGRFANNGWLQELPQSITKVTWDNAAVMSPSTASVIDIHHGQMVTIRNSDGVKVTLPVYELPGCAPGVISVPIGYGRERAGMVGGLVSEEIEAVGVDVQPIRFSDAMLLATSMEARRVETTYDLATTQDHWAIDELGREETEARSFSLVREGTTALLKKLPEFVEAKSPHVPAVGPAGSLWEEPINTIEKEEPNLPQWGMSIDLTKCIGCNACMVACQSENNVPIVGREQVKNSREMHWLRIDRYFQGDSEFADVVQEPVACMHCETAPCEQVCPVAATVHTDEGLNAMAYNRCIGTRYCANNCPFKVRRFNYFNYNSDVGVGYGIDAYESNIENASRKLQALVLNPDVTVRGRGVMEKCTYCVQRIEAAKINARKDGGRPIEDGEVVTACQSACPTRAIEFGNVGDSESKVSKAREDIRSYGMLPQLNVKPRTTYMARIRNTPASLMTTAQLHDLEHLEAPHHGDHHHGDGDHDDHGDHGHGDQGHGEQGHGDHDHGESGHDHDAHDAGSAKPAETT
ncbi:TAT-variant-translocated molybdopterin oxidoreductase [Crateriforma spongiae]|uniref:TAT-variant-translocated molybdopterin oxidoreductase n=1 Tax=Crateriforma spongiae TaxID=2724528 RepID=UPI001446488A|nr:TAT-variant-translocated molybdopterin oxidoreductase [Crateriforma spongiae]